MGKGGKFSGTNGIFGGFHSEIPHPGYTYTRVNLLSAYE